MRVEHPERQVKDGDRWLQEIEPFSNVKKASRAPGPGALLFFTADLGAINKRFGHSPKENRYATPQVHPP
jgi:hypothetical protein